PVGGNGFSPSLPGEGRTASFKTLLRHVEGAPRGRLWLALGGGTVVPRGPTGAVSCAASIAPWPRPPRCARLPQQSPDRPQPGTADRLRPAARAHPARQSAALIPACSAARGGSCDDCSSPQV